MEGMRGSNIEMKYKLYSSTNPRKGGASGPTEGYFCLGTIVTNADGIAIQWHMNRNLGPRGKPTRYVLLHSLLFSLTSSFFRSFLQTPVIFA